MVFTCAFWFSTIEINKSKRCFPSNTLWIWFAAKLLYLWIITSYASSIFCIKPCICNKIAAISGHSTFTLFVHQAPQLCISFLHRIDGWFLRRPWLFLNRCDRGTFETTSMGTPLSNDSVANVWCNMHRKRLLNASSFFKCVFINARLIFDLRYVWKCTRFFLWRINDINCRQAMVWLPTVLFSHIKNASPSWVVAHASILNSPNQNTLYR